MRGGGLKSMPASDVTIVDVKEHQINDFEVIIELLRETKGFSNLASLSVAKTAGSNFNAYCMRSSKSCVVKCKGGNKTVPVIHTDRAIADFKLLETSS